MDEKNKSKNLNNFNDDGLTNKNKLELENKTSQLDNLNNFNDDGLTNENKLELENKTSQLDNLNNKTDNINKANKSDSLNSFANDDFIEEKPKKLQNENIKTIDNDNGKIETEQIKFKRDKKIKRVIEINTDEDVQISGNQIKIVKKGIKTGPSCLSRLFGLFGIAFILILLAGFLTVLKYNSLFLPASEISSEIIVEIPQGSNVTTISKILEEKKVIKSAKAFEITYKIKNKLSKNPIVLKAGEMVLDPSFSISQTINALAKGTFQIYPFTVPEGKNMSEIAVLVEEAGFGKKEDFLALATDATFINELGLSTKSLEGYLFPDTYDFPKTTTQKNIIKTMVKNFLKVWDKYSEMAGESSLTQEEIITLASIVEKETGAPQERPMIAGVFLNRLKKGMRLQTDPTVIYGLTNYTGNITKDNLQEAHPYNTYIINGLPPGPIANPGEAAIKAVLQPDTVSYLYFVSKNDGTHHFSETLAEHNKMVNKYQR